MAESDNNRKFTGALLRPYRIARRIVVGVVGFTVLLLGLIMTVTPGPAIVVIPLGLSILAIEFAWARVWLHKLRRKLGDQADRLRKRGGNNKG